MKVLVTGGAGFIGRWVVKKFIEKKHDVYIIDDFSSGTSGNLAQFLNSPYLKSIIYGNVGDSNLLQDIFGANFDLCIHLACNIEQAHIDNPVLTFDNIVQNTFNLLEEARKKETKIIYISTAEVYKNQNQLNLKEDSLVFPKNPYLGAKLASENLCLSYAYSYQLPIAILRPTFVYGPFQIDCNFNSLKKKFTNANIHTDIANTYDLLFVEDLTEAIYKIAVSHFTNGEVFNIGSGITITSNNLNKLLCDLDEVEFIYSGKVNFEKLMLFSQWEPRTTLEEGIKKTFNYKQ